MSTPTKFDPPILPSMTLDELRIYRRTGVLPTMSTPTATPTIGDEVFIRGLGYIVWDQADEDALNGLLDEIEQIAPESEDTQ